MRQVTFLRILISIIGSILVYADLDLNLKTRCLDDPICNFIKNHISHLLKMKLRGTISVNSYYLRALVQDFASSFGELWIIDNIKIIIKGKSEQESRVYIEGSILYKENNMRGDGKLYQYIVKYL